MAEQTKTKAKKEAPSSDGAMKNLGNLSPAKGSNRPKKRLGRGPGSGLGKTSGKGHKGQKARKGGGVRPGFEGGAMPLYMRLPKRGFTSIFKQQFNVINIDSLEKFPAGATVDLESLHSAGLIRDKAFPIKLLGRGTLDKKLEISVHKASTSAKDAVEKAGGTLNELGYKKRGDAARAKLMKNKKPKIRGVNAKRAWREANGKAKK